MKLVLSLALAVFAVSGSNAKIYFEERFEDGDKWESRWVNSEHKDDLGKFKLTSGNFYGDAEKDKGLQTSQDAKFYAISAKHQKFSNKGKTLVVQFTVKHEQNIDCGGGYVKLFPSTVDQKDLHGESPYNIMFGPDICGPGTRKVHVIFNYKDKNHLINKEIRCKDDEMTHIYTLIVNTEDLTYEVLIDNESEQKGSISDDWDMLPPKKIKDPEVSKPSQEEWDEREKIPDPDDKKPEDWDKPEHIPDPEARKPEDWDDDMDGEWEPPQVDNPEFKGEWQPREIDNPEYKGKWEHPMIDNPDFDKEEEKKLASYDDFGAIGIDVWQVKSGTIFDNILIGDNVEEAKKIAEETWGKTKGPEKEMKDKIDEEEKKKAEEEAKNSAPAEDEEDDEDADDEELDKETEHDEL